VIISQGYFWGEAICLFARKALGNAKMALPFQGLFLGSHKYLCRINYLQQLPIKQITRRFLKVLQSHTFKNLLGLGLSAMHCKHPPQRQTLRIWVCC